jgi:hypothetical protein
MSDIRTQLEARWGELSPQRRILAVTAVAIATGSLLAIAYPGGRTCATQTEAEAYLGDMMSGLQRQVMDETLSLKALADRVKRINDAATRFSKDRNAKAYCEALDAIASDRDP